MRNQDKFLIFITIVIIIIYIIVSYSGLFYQDNNKTHTSIKKEAFGVILGYSICVFLLLSLYIPEKNLLLMHLRKGLENYHGKKNIAFWIYFWCLFFFIMTSINLYKIL